MGVAFRAPRAPIERPKRPSSRFSFCRRIKKEFLITLALKYEDNTLKLFNSLSKDDI